MNTAYDQAATSGRYEVQSGLLGKYDNVRTYWEEEFLRLELQPHVRELAATANGEGRKLRLLDLGCGAGDGFATLQHVVDQGDRLADADARLLTPEAVGFHKGVDINETLLEQAKDRFEEHENMLFTHGDLSQGLPVEDDEDFYDLYFASFGTLSHLHTDETIRLFAEVADHGKDGAILLADWLGRYTYEWQDLWDADTSEEQWMDYRISYIYSAEERATKVIESFPLRLVSSEEVHDMVERANQAASAHLELVRLADRSLFSGRHIDTGEYNGNPMPIRENLNSLHEPLVRTDLADLHFTYQPKEGFDKANRLLGDLAAQWNALLEYTQTVCEQADAGRALSTPPKGITDYLAEGMQTMARVVESCEHFQDADKRANVIEPQLAYCLRNLERSFQVGRGRGHGLVAILRVRK